MNTDDISSRIENYTSLLLNREFAYIFGGGMFFCIIQYILGMKIFLIDNVSLLVLFGYLSASYFIGLSLYQINGYLPSSVKKKNYTVFPLPYDSQLLFTQFLIVNYDKKILNLHERDINLRIVINIIGSCSFFGGILLLINFMFKAVTFTFTYTYTVYVIMIVLLIYGFFLMFIFSEQIGVKIEYDRKNLLEKLFLFKKQKD